MTFDAKAIAQQMLKAALPSLSHYGKYAIETATEEFSTIAELVRKIGQQRAAGEISEQDARDLLDSTKLAYKIAWETQSGEAQIAMEDAVNAALSVVTAVVNAYVGFPLL